MIVAAGEEVLRTAASNCPYQIVAATIEESRMCASLIRPRRVNNQHFYEFTLGSSTEPDPLDAPAAGGDEAKTGAEQ